MCATSAPVRSSKNMLLVTHIFTARAAPKEKSAYTTAKQGIPTKKRKGSVACLSVCVCLRVCVCVCVCVSSGSNGVLQDHPTMARNKPSCMDWATGTL